MIPQSGLTGAGESKSRRGIVDGCFRRRAGFTVIEFCILAMLICILAGFGVLSINAIMPGMQANEAMYQTLSQLRRARNLAIAQRRSIQLRFVGEGQIQLIRNEWPTGTTDLGMVSLGNDGKFMLFDGVPDTPDGFGSASSVDFGDAATLEFRSDGTLVDETGDPVNGSVFLGVEHHPETARAVTVLGATGRICSYRWARTKWIK